LGGADLGPFALDDPVVDAVHGDAVAAGPDRADLVEAGAGAAPAVIPVVGASVGRGLGRHPAGTAVNEAHAVVGGGATAVARIGVAVVRVGEAVIGVGEAVIGVGVAAVGGGAFRAGAAAIRVAAIGVPLGIRVARVGVPVIGMGVAVVWVVVAGAAAVFGTDALKAIGVAVVEGVGTAGGGTAVVQGVDPGGRAAAEAGDFGGVCALVVRRVQVVEIVVQWWRAAPGAMGGVAGHPGAGELRVVEVGAELRPVEVDDLRVVQGLGGVGGYEVRIVQPVRASCVESAAGRLGRAAGSAGASLTPGGELVHRWLGVEVDHRLEIAVPGRGAHLAG
jgi:hypothetical protein